MRPAHTSPHSYTSNKTDWIIKSSYYDPFKWGSDARTHTRHPFTAPFQQGVIDAKWCDNARFLRPTVFPSWTCHMQTVLTSRAVRSSSNHIPESHLRHQGWWSCCCVCGALLGCMWVWADLLYSWRPQTASPICAVPVCHQLSERHGTAPQITSNMRTGRWMRLNVAQMIHISSRCSNVCF